MSRPLSHLWLLAALGLCFAALGCTQRGEEMGSDGSVDLSAPDDASDVADVESPGEDQVAVGPAEIKPGWGKFTGHFTITGAPTPAKIEITKDAAYCGKFELVDESLVVGPNGGLANVVVMLSVKRGQTPPTPHESYNETENINVVLDNLECRFVPRIVLLRETQTLEVKNSDPDPVAHNTKIEADPPINPILPPGGTVTQKFNAQRLPAPVSCSIHPWMTAKLVVKETPYMAVTDENGQFTMENVPSGKWEFQVWQEKLGYVTKVNIGGKDAEWQRGQVEVPISDGETTDWGEVKLDYAKY